MLVASGLESMLLAIYLHHIPVKEDAEGGIVCTRCGIESRREGCCWSLGQ